MKLIAIDLPAEQFADWLEHQSRAYARDKVAAGSWSEAESMARARADTLTLLPNGRDTVGHLFRRIEITPTGELIGWIWVGLATEGPTALAWIYDLEIVAHHRGKGHGRAALALAEAAARELGCTRLGLHVFAHNAVARRLYENGGFELTDLSYAKSI